MNLNRVPYRSSRYESGGGQELSSPHQTGSAYPGPGDEAWDVPTVLPLAIKDGTGARMTLAGLRTWRERGVACAAGLPPGGRKHLGTTVKGQ